MTSHATPAQYGATLTPTPDFAQAQLGLMQLHMRA